MKSLKALVDAARNRLAYHVEKAIIEFTETVAKQMLASNVSKSQLAEKLECSQPFVTKVLRGNNNFTLETMVKIARALESELKVELVPKAAAKSWNSLLVASQERTGKV